MWSAIWAFLVGVLGKVLPALANWLDAYVAQQQAATQQNIGRTAAGQEGLQHAETDAASRIQREAEVARLGGADLDARLSKWVRD